MIACAVRTTVGRAPERTAVSRALGSPRYFPDVGSSLAPYRPKTDFTREAQELDQILWVFVQ